MLINWTDVVDGELVNALTAVAGMVVRPRASRRVAAALDQVGWADTGAIIRAGLPGARLELPDLSDAAAGELEAALRRHETQGALQALLAARLTDAPESDAARAREAVKLALYGSGAETAIGRQFVGIAASFGNAPDPGLVSEATADLLSRHFDDKISALVAELEGRVGLAGLAQVRAEAYNARIVALLGAIDRQVTALGDPERGAQAETEFIERYRRQAHQRHGFLSPPDFDRRRRVPVDAIYVPTGISEEDDPERTRLPPRTARGSLTVRDLAGRLDRTVLLGDPGGGKTTAANVLTDQLASDPAGKIPFLVTLREYAAKTPPAWSVAEYIEQHLKTMYQSPAPDGLVERLLLTGRAVVIFDGLDELLDTSRRRDVSERVEQFCSAYPLTPVLVTSRLVGYDQARLDDDQFRCFRLGGFGDREVAEYAGKWFASQEGSTPTEAEAKATAFLAESASVPDLRSNPLLLALMCILYRGAGSLPGDRAGIYARCAELLLRRWDEHRDLYRKVRADHLVEPTIRYLAWWLFTREDSRAEATERELIAKATEFLYERGYETLDEAQVAAREFVEFCRGRLWVFSDAGTTADGERLYGFTHRTFLEYFAAWHLAATSDTPEDLARNLINRKVRQPGWSVVTELAMSIKRDSSDRAVDRIYAVMLDYAAMIGPAADPGEHEDMLSLLLRCASATRPSPATMRTLIRAVLDSPPTVSLTALDGPFFLLFSHDAFRHLVADELDTRIAATITSADLNTRIKFVQLLLDIVIWRIDGFWQRWSAEQISRHTAEITALNKESNILVKSSIFAGVISLPEALKLPGGLGALLEDEPVIRSGTDVRESYLAMAYDALSMDSRDRELIENFTAIGIYLSARPALPWARCAHFLLPEVNWSIRRDPAWRLSELSGLGIAAVGCMLGEISGRNRHTIFDLPVPEGFRQVFRDWAEGRVNFVEIPGEQSRDRAELRDRSG